MGFTIPQEKAIYTRDKSLLVSAAAGSGKTFTLIQRIIESILDEKNPDDISKMLIVTFTNAAVDELRTRVAGALSKKLKELTAQREGGELSEEEAVRLDGRIAKIEEQLYMLPSAKISTIDAFCNDILKNNTERFGISPRYRIADTVEVAILEHTILTELINAVFDGKMPEVASAEEFEELAAALTGVKSDKELEEAFQFLYDKSKSYEHGISIFTEMRENTEKLLALKVTEIGFVKYAMARVRECAEHYAEIIKGLIKSLLGASVGIDERVAEIRDRAARISAIKNEYSDSKAKRIIADTVGELSYDEKYIKVLSDDLELLTKMTEAKEYTELRDLLYTSFVRMVSIPEDERTDEMDDYDVIRDEMKEALKKYKEKFFSYLEEDWCGHLKDLSRLLGIIERFLLRFDEVYFAEKKKRATFEYSDIERLTYLALCKGNGEYTELADSLREQYSTVYIDEYQDVNAIQNEIFLAISRPDNRFTVGDIKQSIYGFRSARPDIFAEMKGSYPKIEDNAGGSTASIFMSENFRCDEGIIHLTNEIFDEMFTLTASSIGYVSEDKLKFAKCKEERPPISYPEVVLFAKEKDETDTDEKTKSEYEEAEEEDITESTSAAPPEWVADKISEILDSKLRLRDREPTEEDPDNNVVRKSDIAIILRKNNGRAELYKEALEKRGISARVPENKNFFLNPEIQLALCLLNAINNPMRDIYLAGLMLSPLYSFTPSELIAARRFSADSLWGSVKRYANTNEKFKRFVDTLTAYRRISEGMKVDALLLKLYNETGLIALGLGSGSKENLMLLYNYARRFEASSYEGLYSFINYINTVIESKAAFASGKESSDKDSVTIMTVHKSKGLEFPIVFLVDVSTGLISRSESKPKIAYSEEGGIGLKTRMPGGLALVESPIRNVIVAQNIERCIEEELRIYYVALTRAREHLYIVGAPSMKSLEEYKKKTALLKKYKTKYMLRQIKSFVDVLLLTENKASVRWILDGETVENDDKNNENTDTYTENRDGEAENTPEVNDSANPEAADGMHGENTEGKDEKLGESTEDADRDQSGNVGGEDKKGDTGADKDGTPPLTDEEICELLKERFSFAYPDSHLTRLPEKMSISKLSPRVLDENGEDDGDEDADEIGSRGEAKKREAERKKRASIPDFITGKKADESARCGIVTHNVLQFMNLERLGRVGAAGEIDILIKDGFISKDDRGRIFEEEIEAFIKSELYKNMCTAKKVFRELRFSVMLPAHIFTTDERLKELYAGEEILLQGVIDCIYEDSDGEYHLIDYKTDRLSAAQIKDREEARKKLSLAHSRQLNYYALAIREMFGKLPKTLRVYSLPLGDTVDMDRDEEVLNAVTVKK